MLSHTQVRFRVIKLIQELKSVTQYALLRRFDKRDRDRANEEISMLASEGYLILLGIGRRGSPRRLEVGPLFPNDKCPMCGQTIARENNPQ